MNKKYAKATMHVDMAHTKTASLDELAAQGGNRAKLATQAADGSVKLYHLLPAATPAFSGRDGRGPYTYDPAVVLQSFADYGMDLPVDYEHQSVQQPDNYAGPIPAAGWITGIFMYPEGVYASIEWTERAQALLDAKEYRYLSPNILYIPDRANPAGGEVVALTGAGLTNNPNLYLQALNRQAAGGAGDTSHSTNPSEEQMLEKLLAALGLTPEATEDEALAALQSLSDKSKTAEAVAAEVGAEAPTVEGITAAAQSRYAKADELAAATHRADTAESELKALKAAAHAADVDAALQEAVTAGKLTKAGMDDARQMAMQSLDSFKKLMAAVAPSVPLGSAVHGQATDTQITLTAQQKEMARLAGLTEEAYAKALQAQRKSA